MSEQKKINSDLSVHWIIVGLMICLLIIYNIICHTMSSEIQINIDEEQRIFIRTIFYIIAIILFPVVSLLRYILLRLNQTMPGNKSGKNRYLVTILVTMAFIETIGIFGFIMFILGDQYNTLYIFSILGSLGVFLHRPKEEEYKEIIEALRIQNTGQAN